VAQRLMLLQGIPIFPLTQRFFNRGQRTEDRTEAVANTLLEVRKDYPPTAGLRNRIMAFIPGRQDMTAIEEMQKWIDEEVSRKFKAAEQIPLTVFAHMTRRNLEDLAFIEMCERQV
jgi:hypothetical protein